MAFWTLYKREMRSIFLSPVAYVVLAGCALILGAGFSYFLQYFVQTNVKGVSLFAFLLDSYIFWFLIMVQTPLISMRSLSEEYNLGTIEMLLTAPVREWEVVLSKFFSIFSFFLVLWVPIAVNMAFLYTFSNQKFDLTWGTILMPTLMVVLLGLFYGSVGLFASSTSKNQVIAAIVAFAFIFLFFCLSILEFLATNGPSRDVASYLSVMDQMTTACRGIFDTRPLVLYLSGTLFFLFLTQRVLQARRLRS